MSTNNAKKVISSLLQNAGIEINGSKPYDIQVHDERFYKRVINEAYLGFGESYMDGWWDSEKLDETITKLALAKLDEKIKGNWKIAWYLLRSRLFNLQKPSRAKEVGEKHYDIGNDLYEAMLDKRMNYTSAYWKNASNLDEAQEAKLELICQKLELKEGMKILELGCGFGSFAGYAAEKYGVSVEGYTVSKNQYEYAKERYKHLPVKFYLDDYRNAKGEYDRVISIGIMEHVGYRNYRTYMEVVNRTLKPEGIGFVHTIGRNDSTTTANPWITKYIFPNGMLPSIAQLGKAMENLFVMEDWHNFGPYYDLTLMAWYENVNKAWDSLKNKYGERFKRMWDFYLLSSAAGFRSRETQLWQIVFTHIGRKQPDSRVC
jgi:cyclopropane-fatty-acyl-phospholipid synthase